MVGWKIQVFKYSSLSVFSTKNKWHAQKVVNVESATCTCIVVTNNFHIVLTSDDKDHTTTIEESVIFS